MPEFCFLSQNKAYLSQDHTTCHIHKYMLLGKNGRQKNQHSQCKRYPLIPCRNSFLILDPQKTEPAYQTMDRWKQVIWQMIMEYSQPASRSQIPFPSITGLVLVVGYARNMIRHTQRDIISAVKKR